MHDSFLAYFFILLAALAVELAISVEKVPLELFLVAEASRAVCLYQVFMLLLLLLVLFLGLDLVLGFHLLGVLPPSRYF